MVQIQELVSAMRRYGIGAMEAQWLLRANVDHHRMLSTGQVVAGGEPVLD